MVSLSPRETEVVQLIAVNYLSSKEAARKLGISFRTVEVHRVNLLHKFEARNTAELVHKYHLAQWKDSQ